MPSPMFRPASTKSQLSSELLVGDHPEDASPSKTFGASPLPASEDTRTCENGFGTGLYMDADVSCTDMKNDAAVAFANSDGNLTWAPAAGTDAADASAVVGELDVLLTAGRLNAFDRAIVEAYLGGAAVTAVAFPGDPAAATGVELFAENGTAVVLGVDAWRLRSHYAPS